MCFYHGHIYCIFKCVQQKYLDGQIISRSTLVFRAEQTHLVHHLSELLLDRAAVR